MNCREVQHLFDAYLDGELGSSLRAEFHAHCLSCPTCQQELTALRSALDVIATDRNEPAVSRGFTDRVVERLAMPSAAGKSGRAHWVQVIYRLGTSTAAAAAIILAVLLAWPRQLHDPSEPQMAAAPGPVILGYQEYNPLYESLLAPLVDEARRGWQDTCQATAGLANAGQAVLYDANQVLLCTFTGEEAACGGDEYAPLH